MKHHLFVQNMEGPYQNQPSLTTSPCIPRHSSEVVGSFQILKASIYPLHRLTATPLTFLNQLLAILEFWMSGYENWQIDSVDMSKICLLFAKDFTGPIFVPPMWWNHSQKSIAFAFDWSPIINWWYSNFPWMVIISQQISNWVQWTHVFLHVAGKRLEIRLGLPNHYPSRPSLLRIRESHHMQLRLSLKSGNDWVRKL